MLGEKKFIPIVSFLKFFYFLGLNLLDQTFSSLKGALYTGSSQGILSQGLEYLSRTQTLEDKNQQQRANSSVQSSCISNVRPGIPEEFYNNGKVYIATLSRIDCGDGEPGNNRELRS